MHLLKLVFSLGLIFTSCSICAQSYDAQISGSIVGNPDEAISDVTVSLYQGFDSITSTKTDRDGLFLIEAELMDESDYTLRITHKTEGQIKDELQFQTEMYRSDFVFELVYPIISICNLNDNHISYYLANETKKPLGFDVKSLLDLIEKHPEICIEFSQTIIRSESEKTARKRMANFKKHIEDSGVDISCIRFSDEIHTLQAFHDDQRSRIEGAIYSLDSKCN